MVDNLSPEQRRKNMQHIRSKNTKIENEVSKHLWNMGFRVRKNVKDLFGKPDISIKKYKVVIFIDSCFWHSCPVHNNIPSTNQTYWIPKLKRNQQRDMEVTSYYQNMNWNILRIWEHEFKQDFQGSMNRISQFILNAVKNSKY